MFIVYTVTQDELSTIDFDLAAEIASFKAAVDAHRFTVDIPAPTASHPLVDLIVRGHSGQYQIEPPPPPPSPPPPPDLYEVAADARYAAETSGIILNGARILTDRQSQALINGAVALVQISPTTTIRFKTAAGYFVTLNAQQIVGIGLAVGQHVQNCFSREADVSAEIAAGALTTEEAVRARFQDLTGA